VKEQIFLSIKTQFDMLDIFTEQTKVEIITFMEKVSGFVFSIICHNNSSILMSIGGKQFLLCPRCMGLQLGFFLTLFALFLFHRGQIKFSGKYIILILISACSLTWIHWYLGFTGILVPDIYSRFSTGLISGIGLSIFLIKYRRDQNNISDAQTFYFNIYLLVFLMIFVFSFSYLLFRIDNWLVMALFVSAAILTNVIAVTITSLRLLRIQFYSNSILSTYTRLLK
jgi:uncharacterized membrane protein